MKETDKNEILNAIGKLNEKFDTVQEQVAKIPEMQNDIANIQTDVANMKTDVANMKTDMANIQTDVVNIQNNIRNINRSVAVIEHEHGDKLKALFDAFMVNNEKIYQEQERVSFCERKLENHDTEIYYLKTKVQGL